MLSVRRGFDGLWHCLRPAFTIPTSTASSQLFKPLRSFLNKSHLAPYHGPAESSIVPSHFDATSQQRQSFRPIRSGPYELPREPKYHEFKNTNQAYVSHELDNDALYQELLCAGGQGNFIRVYVLVEELVKSRGEQPNSRLYLALISANANPQHGSPSEVRRLLSEMADEGITPDSAIYHAVLKVILKTSNRKYICLQMFDRSWPYIRITFCVKTCSKSFVEDGLP